jgi:putrescine:ornithine antiporter
VLFASGALAQTQRSPAPGSTLDRIKQSGRIRLGYRADAPPFSFRDSSGNAAGFTVALCEKITDAVKTEAGVGRLQIEWVPVTVNNRFQAVQQGQVDLLCGAETETLTRRQEVSFSLPVFPGGIGALLSSSANPRLVDILSGKIQTAPVWRASAGQLLSAQTFSVIGGTTAEPWLAEKMKEFTLTASIAPVKSYEEGVQRVLEHKTNVFFGDRAILLDAVRRNSSGQNLKVLDRFFTYEPLALALSRGDDAFRFVVDRTLSRFYGSMEFRELYRKWFGQSGPEVQTFYRWNSRPE